MVFRNFVKNIFISEYLFEYYFINLGKFMYINICIFVYSDFKGFEDMVFEVRGR